MSFSIGKSDMCVTLPAQSKLFFQTFFFSSKCFVTRQVNQSTEVYLPLTVLSVVLNLRIKYLLSSGIINPGSLRKCNETSRIPIQTDI